MYEPKTYRHLIKDTDLASFTVTVKETDLYIRASRNLNRKALKAISRHRDAIERYIERYPTFLTSLEPISVDFCVKGTNFYPQLIQHISMLEA